MRSDKYRQLIDRLIMKTDRRELDWKEGVHPESFQVSFPRYSLLIRKKEYAETYGTPSQEISITMLDMFGKAIDIIFDFDIDTEKRERPYYLKMHDLFGMVRQQALGAEKAVEEILSELGD